MDPHAPIVQIGQLVGESHRLSMLLALAGGQALPAGELAKLAGVQPPTASHHLELLVTARLVTVIRQGRHRYYSLAGPGVARLLEQLAALAPQAPITSLKGAIQTDALRFARTCYDHLAGRLGVAWTQAWVARGFVTPVGDGFLLESEGRRWLQEFGVVGDVRRVQVIAEHAVDWTERLPHFAGPIAKAMTTRLIEAGWFQAGPVRRTLRLTATGERELRAFGCEW